MRRFQLILLMPLLAACNNYRHVPRFIHKVATIQLTGDSDVIRGRIRSGGYFERRETRYLNRYVGDNTIADTALSRLILFRNGSFRGETIYTNPRRGCKDWNSADDCIVSELGAYTISHDTVIIQFVEPPYPGINSSHWALYERRYRIIDSQTLQFIFQLRFSHGDSRRKLLKSRAYPKAWVADGGLWEFVPSSELKPAADWLGDRPR